MKIFIIVFMTLFFRAEAKSLRIISTSPAITEIVYALGGEQQLVGVSTFCNYPVAAIAKSKVGTPFDFDFEKTISLKPTVVLLGKTSSFKTKDNLNKLGISYKELPQESLADIFKSVKNIAEILGEKNKGDALVEQIKSRLRFFKRKSLDLNKRVLITIGHQQSDAGFRSFFIMGKKTFYQDILVTLKLVNGYEGKSDRPIISNEAIMKINPDIIIDILPPESNNQKVLRFWEKHYMSLKAVRNKEVHVLSADYMMIPGPRVIDIADDIFKAVNKK